MEVRYERQANVGIIVVIVIASSMCLSTSVSRTPQKRTLLCKKANVEEIYLELSIFYDDYGLDFANRYIDSNWSLYKESYGVLFITTLTRSYLVIRMCFTVTHSLKTQLNKKRRFYRAANRSGFQSARARCNDWAMKYKREVPAPKNKFYGDLLPSML